MNLTTDERELLASYVSHSSPEAFAELVRQNADLVYSAACRQLGDPHLAEEVAQAVFVLLSRKAARVKGPLAGWLVLATHFACRDARKLATRRQFHERQAAQMRPEQIPSSPEPAWETYAPLLDSALADLKQKDRDALALRYLRGLSLKGVATRLGITDKAAEKRVSRGLHRLREILSAKTPVPEVAALSAQIAARSIQAAPARLIETSAATAGSAARNTLAHAIANKAAHAMAMIKIKIAAIIIVAIGVAGAGTETLVKLAAIISAPAPAAPAISPPPVAVPMPQARTIYAGPPESQVPGEIQLAQWDILLTATGGAIVQQMGNPVASPSTIYRARIIDAAQLRQAVADAAAAGDVAQAPPDMEFAAHWPPDPQRHVTPLYFLNGNYLSAEELGMLPGIESRSDIQQDTYSVPDGGDRVDVHLNHPDVIMTLFEGDPAISPKYRAYNPLRTKVNGARIVFDGALQAGQSLAFIARDRGKFQTYYHMFVWETFHADSRKIICYQGQHDELWWCQGGQQKMRQWTEASDVWDADVTGNWRDCPPAFRRTLDNGTTVQIGALSRASQWPFCWWDAVGQPSDAGQDGMIDLQHSGLGLWAVVQVYGQTAPNGEQSSNTRTVPVPEGANRQIHVGVSIWPGIEVARVKIGQTTMIDGAHYRITHSQHFSDHSFTVQLERVGQTVPPLTADYVLRLIAVDNAGNELHDEYWNQFERVNIAVGKNPGVDFNPISDFGMNLKNVAYFRVMRCPRQWVSFTGYATRPVTPPNMNVTAQQAANAEALRPRLQEEKSQEQDAAQLAAERKTWAAIRPDLTTPDGAIRLMLNAARAGDARTVRLLMVSHNPYLNRLLDIGASFFVLNQQLRAKAIDRFGIAAVDAQLGDAPFFADMERAVLEGSWKPTADGSALEQSADGVALLRKNSHGHYYLDMDGLTAQANNLEIAAAQFYCQTLIAHAKPIEQLLSSPTVTIDQIKSALKTLPQPPQFGQ